MRAAEQERAAAAQAAIAAQAVHLDTLRAVLADLVENGADENGEAGK